MLRHVFAKVKTLITIFMITTYLYFMYKLISEWNINKIQDEIATEVQPLDYFLSYPHKKPLKIRCKTCAYVTGSGHLLGSKKGNEIDSKDCVFRSNDAPTIGYEDDVGSKTTFRTLGKKTLENTVRRLTWKGKEKLIKVLSDPKYILYLRPSLKEFMDKALNVSSKLSFLYITKEGELAARRTYNNHIGSLLKGTYLSNGFYTIWIAVKLCSEVHVYGVTNHKYCDLALKNKLDDVPYHYYGDVSEKECDYMRRNEEGVDFHLRHQFMQEKTYFNRLRLNFSLFFHLPEW